MSAKPIKQMDNTTLDHDHHHDDQRSQGVFVKGDPALANHLDGNKKSQTINPNIDANLRTEKLTYVLQMLKELQTLSRSIDQPMIAYLIEMALLETDTALHVGQFQDEFNAESNPMRK